MDKNKIIISILALIAIALATLIRFRFNTSLNYLIIGADGPYYPLQVRSLLENGKLAFKDMPLIFILEAIVAKIMYVFHALGFNESVLFAVKYFDVFIPPLAAIPFYQIIKSYGGWETKSWWKNMLLLFFVTLNFSTIFFFMNSGLQKNAFAIVWVFYFFYFVIRFINNNEKNALLKAVGFLFLCMISHFGTFALLLFFIVLAFLIYSIQRIKSFDKTFFINFGKAVVLIVFLLITLYFIDYQRFDRLLSLPFRIFQAPLLLYILNGQGEIVNPMIIIHIFVFHILAILGLIIFLKNKNQLECWQKLLVIVFLLMVFTLSSPILGIEWVKRFSTLSYIPLSLMFLILVNFTNSKWWLYISLFLIFLLFALPTIGGLFDKRATAIDNNAFDEFGKMKNSLNFEKNDVIIGRQDLRLLGNWFFQTQSSADYLIKKEDFNKYHAVYLINQIDGNNLKEDRFRQADIPQNATEIYHGKYFELYQLTEKTDWNGGFGKPMIAKGQVIQLEGNSIILQNKITQKQKRIILDRGTNYEFLAPQTYLKNGMFVEIWGNRTAFSLDLKAELIKETKE